MSRPSTPRAAPSFTALVQSFFTEYLSKRSANNTLAPSTAAC